MADHPADMSGGGLPGPPPLPDPDPATLTATGVSHRFGERQALDDVSFTVREGELLALIGPNGAGKTTLLSILAGALEPSSGMVTRPGGVRSVGWVPQQPALYSKLTVAENLRLFARLERVPDVDGTVTRMLDQTDLTQRAGDRVATLSGGNRQRVNIALGLLSGPAVLLLDEPSASLDPRQRERLWEFIATLAGSGTSVVYSTHDLQEAQRHSRRVLVLEDGRLKFAGASSAAATPERGRRR